MHKEWTVYRGTRVHGFDLYELKIDPDKGVIMCLEDDDPEGLANCSVWTNPPLAVINSQSEIIFQHAAKAVRNKFPDIVCVKPVEKSR